MSLQTRLEALASDVGADVKSILATIAKTVTARDTVIGSGDWNTYTTPGTYQVAGGTWTNGPAGAYAFGQLLVFANGSIITQVYTTHSGVRTYIRSKYNVSDWQGWQLLAVSTDAMTPTAHTHSAATDLTGQLNDVTMPLRFRAAAADNPISNPDSATQSGAYYVSGLTNGPPASTDYFLHVTAYSPSWVRQMAFDSRTIKVWTRFKLGTNNTWSAWTELYSAASPPAAPLGSLIAAADVSPANAVTVTSTYTQWISISTPISFVAPSSGKALVRLEVYSLGNTSGDRVVGIRNNTGLAIDLRGTLAQGAQGSLMTRHGADFFLTGLVSGTTINLDWMNQYISIQAPILTSNRTASWKVWSMA